MPISSTISSNQSLMPSGAIFGQYEEYTEEDWGQQAPQFGCTCGYCAAFFQYHPNLYNPNVTPLMAQQAAQPQVQSTASAPGGITLSTVQALNVFATQSVGVTTNKKIRAKDEELVVGGIPIKTSVELTRELSKTKVLYLLRGANGSGKSTLAFLIAGAYRKLLGVAVNSIESDDFFTRLNVEGESVFFFEESKLPEAHAQCQDRVRQAMDPNNPGGEGFRVVIVSNTFVSRQHLLPYQRLAREFGYKVVEIICKNDFGNLHGVPPDKVRKTRQNFEN